MCAKFNKYKKFRKFLGKPKPCILCGPQKKKIWAREGIFKAVECKSCGLIWIDPFLTKEGLQLYYSNYIEHRLKDSKARQLRDRMYEIDRDFLQRYISEGKILDIGCNGGFFLNKLSKKFDRYGIDIDPKAVRYAHRHFTFGRHVYNYRLIEDRFPEEYFDVLIMRGVIEHLPDPKSAVERVSSLLKKKGLFYITATPNADSFCAYFYREKWRLFDPIQHIYYFNIRNLSRLVGLYRLKLLAWDYPYLETPYANIKLDYARVVKDLQLITKGKPELVTQSPPFWGSMLTVIFQKE